MIKKTLIIICLVFVATCVVYAQREEVFIYDSKGKRDPFLSLVSPEGFLINLESTGDTSEIILEGIIYDPRGSSYAIINAEVVAPGDTIGRFEVIDIKKNKIILLRDGERIEVKLEEGK